MKVCNDYRLLIQFYIDGELSAGERREVEQHLADCPACRRYCEEICMVNRAVQDVDYPRDLHAGIMAAVKAERAAAAEVIPFPECKAKKNTAKKGPARRWIGTVAAMLAVACVGLFGMESGLTSMFSGMGAAQKDAAVTESAMLSDTAAESVTEAPRAEEKAVAPAPSTEETGNVPEPEGKVVRIEETAAGWFTDDTDHVDVVSCNVPVAMEAPEEAPADEEMPQAEEPLLNEDRMEELAAMIGDCAEDYGFCLVTAGSIEQLPDVFADQAEEAVTGFTLVITVRNDSQVRSQIGEIMASCGFEVCSDTEAWFAVDPEAAEGLVIVDLTE